MPPPEQSSRAAPPDNTCRLPRYWGSSPSSLSSYSTRNPDTVSEAETQETTKLLAVISVTDSEVATTGEKGVVSPVTVLPKGSRGRGGTRSFQPLRKCSAIVCRIPFSKRAGPPMEGNGEGKHVLGEPGSREPQAPTQRRRAYVLVTGAPVLVVVKSKRVTSLWP